MNDMSRETNQSPEDHQEMLANLSTVLVEVFGGVVQNVQAAERVPHPVKVVVRDHDNLKVDPDSPDEEWLIGDGDEGPALPVSVTTLDDKRLSGLAEVVAQELDGRGLRDPSYVEGYKQGFIAALRDDNWGPEQVWTDQEVEELFKEIDTWFC